MKIVKEEMEYTQLYSEGDKQIFKDAEYSLDPKIDRGVSCNPAGQANHLKENNTDLNVMMGLCLGHDIIFNAKSKVPVTPLIVKDRKLKHRPLVKFKKKRNRKYFYTENVKQSRTQ